MHYYKRNIGDYHKKAGRLTMLEHGAYTLLLDACYDREQFPTLDEAIDWAWARTEAEVQAVKFVLSKFFTLVDGRYVQNHVVEELEAYKEKAETNARIAQEREAKRKNRARVVDETSPNVHEAPPNHKPITNNQEPIKKEKNAGEDSEPDYLKTDTARNPVAPHRVKFSMALDWKPSDQFAGRAKPQGINPDLVTAELLAGFVAYYEPKDFLNNQGEWENLLVRWVKNESAKPAPKVLPFQKPYASPDENPDALRVPVYTPPPLPVVSPEEKQRQIAEIRRMRESLQ